MEALGFTSALDAEGKCAVHFSPQHPLQPWFIVVPKDGCVDLIITSVKVANCEALVAPVPAELFYSPIFVESVTFPTLASGEGIVITFAGAPRAIFDVWFGDKEAVRAKFYALALG